MPMTRAELEAFRGVPLPDEIGPGVRLLFVGVNPGLRSAAVGAPFANRGNRFWKALHAAGITGQVFDTSAGFAAADRDELYGRGVGLTTLVPGATARADELADDQLRAGRAELVTRVTAVRPAVVAMLGITAFRIAFDRPRAVPGEQPDPIGPARLWVVPNPSGLNAHATVESLGTAYRAAAAAAGVPLLTPEGPPRPPSGRPPRPPSGRPPRPPSGRRP
ncbi:G/U mismatch-specific uracil-DNA glycosylase [Curtobacterium sp. PhB130]|uniref:mismatch-specific DNA-glycosylase n=1 Tax=Curtobacterium sp. PhB130 TaxID=2485178 RepID=UPI000F4C47EA|nr:mismatch-specific DNA-glycosylase [Curtobacterium sp. PhB130]ROS77959.1 G/U mismatch-specific uracil-DNA glycosylase [Curtobacterium sp. PhB130]